MCALFSIVSCSLLLTAEILGDLAAEGEEDSNDESSLPSVESPKEHRERDHTPDRKAAPEVIKNPISMYSDIYIALLEADISK